MRIQPLTGSLGAEVTDVDISGCGDDAIDVVRDALVDHKVLVFRGQTLNDGDQRDFASLFGPVRQFPFGKPVDASVPEVHAIATGGGQPKTSNADIWHSDATFMASPPLGTVLRAVQLPSCGGDTLFADAAAAFDTLSSRIQRLVDELTAVHDVAHSTAHRQSMHDRFPPVVHPVVRVHPESRRRTLFVNRTFTVHINEISERENDVLLPLLCDQMRAPDIQCRVRWEPGTLVMWDNRATQHYAVWDYTERRVMHRVVIDGDVPLGVGSEPT